MSFKSGFVAINGRPNVGKSTLLNHFLGHKVAIMSPKAQTTRNVIQGIYNEDNCQIIFIDTPGIHKPHTKLGEYMNNSALGASRDVEAILILNDITEDFGPGDNYVIENLKQRKSPVIYVINKVDLVNKEKVLARIDQVKNLMDFKAIIPVSAKKGTNCDDLLKTLKDLMPDGPKYYPESVISDHPESFIISELIREKILFFTQEEVPHSVAVILEKNEKQKNGKVAIAATIIVERASQKKIIIGHGGSMIKKIGIAARKDIESLLGSKVILTTFVRVEEDWRNRTKYLKEFGYREGD